MSQHPVRWGVLSTARIGTSKVIPAMLESPDTQVIALASRNAARATETAQSLGIDRSYASYEALLEDDEIDAVYNPLPNHLHVDWTIRALRAGKHVLCEKPIGMNAADAQRLLDACQEFPHLKVMEAFMYRHHPQWQRTHELIAGGAIGSLRAMQFTFCYSNTDRNDIRNQATVGGGALMDIGCYPISVSRWVLGCQPRRVIGCFETSVDFGTDILTSGILEFPGAVATFSCSTQLPRHQFARFLGTTGRIELPWPFNPEPLEPSHLDLIGADGEKQSEEFPPCNQYGLQVQRMNDAIRHDRPVPTGLEDALQNMQVIDALVASRDSNGWVTL
jgi:predicted dehydrogenase